MEEDFYFMVGLIIVALTFLGVSALIIYIVKVTKEMKRWKKNSRRW